MIRKKLPPSEIVIDLTGPEGNAFSLMARATSFAKQLGFDGASIVEEMTSGDYENLLQVMEHYFGDLIIMYR